MLFLLSFILNFIPILCEKSLLVETSSGLVLGKTVKINSIRVEQYLNIPYAEPPVGRLRFSRPVILRQRIKGIIDGTKIGNACFQSHSVYNITVPQSEDCLVLNVWTKRSTVLKPVMFWIHGGGYSWGTIFQPVYNGTALAAKDVVIVTVNYRLGPFGWLYGGDDSAPGNIGLYDQLLALYWVKNNIQLFGGDPNCITLFGESAGSASVSAHILSSLSKGLFKRAILESGTVLGNKLIPDFSKTKALSEAKTMAKHFNCSEAYQWLDCLRSVDAKELNSYENLTLTQIFGTEYLPVLSQKAFKDRQYNTDIEIMAGITQNEGSILSHWFVPQSEHLHSEKDFRDLMESLPNPNLNATKVTAFYLKNVDKDSTEALKQAFYDFYGDFGNNCRTYFFAKLFAEYTPKRNVYFYYWTYVSRLIASELGCAEDMGVCHLSDVPYVFGQPVFKNMSDKSFSEYVMKLWTNFAKFG